MWVLEKRQNDIIRTKSVYESSLNTSVVPQSDSCAKHYSITLEGLQVKIIIEVDRDFQGLRPDMCQVGPYE